MGFEPTTPNLGGSIHIDCSRYREYLSKVYGNDKQYATAQYNYAIKYLECYSNPSKLLSLPTSIKANVLKSLICLSKYIGEYSEFKAKLKEYGVKWIKPDSFSSFLNILNNNSEDLAKWFKDVSSILHDNYKLFLRFTLLSGMRKAEAIHSYNKIIELSKDGKLSEYYNRELSILEHFRYPKEFFRNTKNVYVSILPNELIEQIAKSQCVSYFSIHKKLERKGIKIRVKELRSYYASYLRKHGVISELIDLLQGRISKDVFVRHYLKENPKTLSCQVLALLKDLESSLA